MGRSGSREREGIVKEHKEALRGEEYVHCINFSDNFMDMYTYTNLSIVHVCAV